MITQPVAIEVGRPTAIAPRRVQPPDAVPALITCLDELARRGVRHCVWKSNLHLRAALAGETDVDLLVDRQDASVFREVVVRHGLKPLVPPPAAAHQGMEHLLGFDAPSGKLFHLHVHYQLVLGAQYVKNHRLPVENELLARTRVLHGVPVPAAELELPILVVRALLKYRARDVVKDLFGIRSPGIPAETQAEVAWLRNQTTVRATGDAVGVLGDVVPLDVVGEFLETMSRAPRSGYELLRLRTRLRGTVRGLERRGRARASIGYFRMVWGRRSWTLGRPRREPRMAPAGGGVTVGFIGADGSGKSTVANAAARWLGWKLDARVHYMGSKAPSRPTDGLYLVFRALRRGHRAASRRFGPGSPAARSIAGGRDMALALHHLSVGRDRIRRYRAGHHDAGTGRIALFDRYPLELLSDRREHRLLDGPQISSALGEPRGRITAALAAAEERMYRRFALPDHVMVLDVGADVGAARKPDHSRELIRAKSAAASELANLAEAAGAQVTRIDANRPLDDVLLDVKARLWDAL